MNIDDWKTHFAQQSAEWWDNYNQEREASEPIVEVELNVGEDPEDINDPEEEDEQPEDLPFYTSGIIRRDINVLLYVRETLRRQIQRAHEQARAKDIRQVDKSCYLIQPNSTLDYIRQVLLAADKPLHINSIIQQIEVLGWKSSSTYHKYAQVSKVLRTNDYMFCRVGKAAFKLCEGFSERKIANMTQPKHRKKLGNKLTTMRDVVLNIANEYQKTNNGTYPGQVHYTMIYMGFSCAYSTVYRIMQGNEFVRDDYWYRLVDI